MSNPIIIWIAIIGLFVAIIVVRLTVTMVRSFHKNHSRGIISIATDREMFFVPGDIKEEDDDEACYGGY